MLEIIAGSLQDAITIEECGGNRIELVQSLGEGGLTPSYGLVKKVLTHVIIPVNVMLRTNSRSFHCSMHDIDVMKEDALIFHELGVHHVVLGILDIHGMPDLRAMEYILENTDLTMTFHRAIDESRDIMEAVKRLKTYRRCTHILTSGGLGQEGVNIGIVRDIIVKAKGMRVIVASGIDARNLNAIRNELDFSLLGDEGEADNYDFHVGTGVRGKDYRNPVSEDEVKELVAIYNHAQDRVL